jgi:hypothetical protein
MFELASGEGEWDGTITNPENPARRDTHVIKGNGYFVFVRLVLFHMLSTLANFRTAI